VQSRRFALQELLLQFLLITSTIRAVSYFIKKCNAGALSKV